MNDLPLHYEYRICIDTPLGAMFDKELKVAILDGLDAAIVLYNRLHRDGFTTADIQEKRRLMFPPDGKGAYWKFQRGESNASVASSPSAKEEYDAEDTIFL